MVLSYLNETYPRIDIQSKQNKLSSKFFKTQEISSNDVMTRLKPTPGNGSGTIPVRGRPLVMEAIDIQGK